VIPPAGEIEVVKRRKPKVPPGEYMPYQPDSDGVAPMADCGEGYRIHVTGLTHDERGYPGMNAKTQEQMMERLIRKIRSNRDSIIRTENVFLDDAEVVVVAYGISARSARQAVQEARAKGIRAGLIKLETVWPFPEELIRSVASRVRALIMPEINAGQMVLELERCAGGACPVRLVAHYGGALIPPAKVLDAVQKALKEKR
jgi:2-oxoglutarate ferredoxin oxidoreductase subunit alpha